MGKKNLNELHQILPQLKEEQAKQGFISKKFMNQMASGFGVSVSGVYGVASFYSFLSTEPQGKHFIRICKNVPCGLKDAEMIIRAVQEKLGIAPGETTEDGRFTFELTNCIGACDQAPAMLVDDDVHGNLTPEKIGEILRTDE